MNVFLVHGSIGKPFENWFPWLEGELSSKDIACVIPTFPTPEYQNYDDWKELMDYYVQRGIVNQETVVIGHSCGTVFLTHYILEKKLKVKAFIAVSGYNHFISGYDFMDRLNSSFYMDFESLNLSKYVDKIIALYGDDDPNIPQTLLKEFAEAIGASEIHAVKGAGHFNAAAGYLTCPLVLEKILNIIKSDES